MSTVYSVNGITLVRDLVFGWHVTLNDQWVPLAELSTNSLRQLYHMYFPYDDNFKESIRRILQKRTEEEQRPVPVPASIVTETNPTRDNDRAKLLTSLMEKASVDEKGMIVYDVGYLRVVQEPFHWTIVPSGVGKVQPIRPFEKLEDVIDFILKRWW